MIEVIKLSGTTDTGGDLTVNGDYITGLLLAVDLEISAADATADHTVSIQSTDVGNAYNVLVVANSQTDKRYYPRTLEHLDTDGTALATHTPHAIAGKPRYVVAQGGSTKAVICTLTILVED
jgi:hypothetical protein